MTVETLTKSPEIEQNIPREIEQKFVPRWPEEFTKFRPEATPIEQFYLSHPNEPFSLRMREYLKDGELCYEATMKDTGIVSAEGLNRIEVTTPISAELYQQYRTAAVPILRKLRSEPLDGIVVDFFEDGSIAVESESAVNWQRLCAEHDFKVADISGDKSANNEWRAHMVFSRANRGAETLVPEPDLQAIDIVNKILSRRADQTPVIIHIGGRSGSGKSTIVREVESLLREYELSSAVMSTDDYHRGNTWLQAHNDGQPWTHWDEAIVYDTEVMAEDIKKLKSGQPINRRTVDWTTVEPTFEGEITPSDVIIIEGIYATSPDITNEEDLSYLMSTPLATCIGRRILRDMRERPQFADPAVNLYYMLSEAEPAYLKQQIVQPVA